ncbi:MAG: SRPBCC family protein [Myxococcota bacterium]
MERILPGVIPTMGQARSGVEEKLKRSEVFEIADRLLEHIRNGTTDSDERGPIRVPATTYTDPGLFEREREGIFANAPQLVCLSGDIPEPGDYVTLDDLGLGLLILRDEERRVRSFLNACTHRGARLAEGRGQLKDGLICPYHGWAFRLDGSLDAVAHAASFGNVAASDHALRELPCGESGGLVFSAPRPEADFDLEAHMGTLAEELDDFDLSQCVPVKSGLFDVEANWKLCLDTFSEGYHFPVLHRDSLSQMTIGNVMTYDRFGERGEHHRLGYPARTIIELGQRKRNDWGDPYEHFGCVYFIYPNVSMLVSGQYVDLFRIYPGHSVNRQRTHYSLYARKPLKNGEGRAAALDYFDYNYHVVEKEDFWVSECAQRNLDTGALAEITFGRNEPALINLHEVMRRALDSKP